MESSSDELDLSETSADEAPAPKKVEETSVAKADDSRRGSATLDAEGEKGDKEVGGKEGKEEAGVVVSLKGESPHGVGDSKHPPKRKCTDVFCLFFFILFWVGMITIGAIGIALGDPARLIYPQDYEANLCGFSCANQICDVPMPATVAGMGMPINTSGTQSCGCLEGTRENKTFVFYPRLSQDLMAYAARVALDQTQAASLQLYGICVKRCPAINEVICNYDFEVRHRSESHDASGARMPAFYNDVRTCVEWYKSNCFAGLCNTYLAEGVVSRFNCYDVGRQCFVNPFQQKNLYKMCLPLSDPEQSYTREVCSDPVEPPNADWTCLDVLGEYGGNGDPTGAVARTFQLNQPDQSEAYEECKVTAQRMYDDGNYVQSVNGTLALQQCRIRKCQCNPFMCLNSQGERDATPPQIFLPTILSDGLSTVIEKDTGCEVVNRSTYSFTRESASKDGILDALQSTYEWVVKLIADLVATYLYVLLFGGGVGVVGSFLFLIFLRLCLKCLIVIIEILIIVCGILYSLYALALGGTIPRDTLGGLYNATRSFWNETGTEDLVQGFVVDASSASGWWQAVGWITLIVVILFIGLLIYARKAIDEAIAIIQEGSRAVMSMCCLVYWPLITTVWILLLTAFFAGCLALLFSADDGSFTVGTISQAGANAANSLAQAGASAANSSMIAAPQINMTNNTYLKRNQDVNVVNYLAIYLVFGYLWTLQFNLAVLLGVVSGAVASWYWTEDNPAEAKARAGGSARAVRRGSVWRRASRMPRGPICKSFWHTVRYWLGSMAHASFWIALVQLIRLILAYIDQKTKALQERSGWIKILARVIMCCLFCFEKCIKYISRMGLIIVVLESENFCTSAFHAFKMIAANKLRFAFTTIFTSFSLVLGKILVTGVAAGGMYITIRRLPQFRFDCDPNLEQFKDLHCTPVLQPAIPVLITAICAYFISSAFMYVVEIAVDTILMSFSWDVSHNDKDGTTPEKLFLHEDSNLRRTLDSSHPHQKEKKAKEQKAKEDRLTGKTKKKKGKGKGKGGEKGDDDKAGGAAVTPTS